MRSLRITYLDLDDTKNQLLSAGQARATYEVAKYLIGRGHKVTVICSRYPGYKDRMEDGIYYKHIGLGTSNIKINNLAYIFSVPFAVTRIKADIIVECFTAPVSTLLSPLFTKIPVVALPTSFDAERFSKIYHFPFWIIERKGSKLYKYFAALTPFLATKMKKYNKNVRVKLIPQGVSDIYFKIKNKNPEHILFIGRLDINQKGLDLLLNAYSKVVDKIGYPLVIAGAGPDKERLRKIIKELKLSKYVRMVGFANEGKKIELLSYAAFVVFPSRSEGFSLVSLEALASGKKLVSFDIPSLDWATDRVISKVKPFDTDKYSKALLGEAQKKYDFQNEEKIRNYVKKYAWENIAQSFEDFFLEIVN